MVRRTIYKLGILMIFYKMNRTAMIWAIIMIKRRINECPAVQVQTTVAYHRRFRNSVMSQSQKGSYCPSLARSGAKSL